METTIKNLQGSLWLTWYYHKFVKTYGSIVAPLTSLMKKDAFSRNLEAMKAFQHLKEAMFPVPVLAMPDFTKKIIIECDASGNGIGAIFMKEGRLVSFEIHPI